MRCLVLVIALVIAGAAAPRTAAAEDQVLVKLREPAKKESTATKPAPAAKPAAKKPVAKKAVANKTTAKKRSPARKPVAKKPAKKPAKKSSKQQTSDDDDVRPMP